MFERLCGSALVMIGMACTYGCSSLAKVSCSVDHAFCSIAEAEECAATLQSSSVPDSRAVRALENLDARLADYRQCRMSCSKFHAFYEAHIAQECR